MVTGPLAGLDRGGDRRPAAAGGGAPAPGRRGWRWRRRCRWWSTAAARCISTAVPADVRLVRCAGRLAARRRRCAGARPSFDARGGGGGGAGAARRRSAERAGASCAAGRGGGAGRGRRSRRSAGSRAARGLGAAVRAGRRRRRWPALAAALGRGRAPAGAGAGADRRSGRADDAALADGGGGGSASSSTPADPRLAIVACSGAPACARPCWRRGRWRRRSPARPELRRGCALHLSGCGKRCAQPAGPA